MTNPVIKRNDVAALMFVLKWSKDALAVYELAGLRYGEFLTPESILPRVGAVVARHISKGKDKSPAALIQKTVEAQPAKYVALVEFGFRLLGLTFDREATMAPYVGSVEDVRAKIRQLDQSDSDDPYPYIMNTLETYQRFWEDAETYEGVLQLSTQPRNGLAGELSLEHTDTQKCVMV